VKEKTLGQVAAEEMDLLWDEPSEVSWERIAAAVVAEHERRKWRPISEAPSGVKLDHVGTHWDGNKQGWLGGLGYYKEEAITSGFKYYFMLPLPPERP